MGNHVKIRLQGSPEDVEAIVNLFKGLVDVLEEADTYRNEREFQFLKCYLTVKQIEKTEAPDRLAG